MLQIKFVDGSIQEVTPDGYAKAALKGWECFPPAQMGELPGYGLMVYIPEQDRKIGGTVFELYIGEHQAEWLPQV